MKKHYQSPSMKVVEFKVERGFEGSYHGLNLNTETNMFEMEFDANGPREEAYLYNECGTDFFE